MKILLISFVFLFVAFTPIGRSADFRYLRTNEGLYNGEINAIAQDHSGKMWFATWTGLTNYNGFDFRFFKPILGNPQSLPDKKTHRILIDSENDLWVASLSGVTLYNRNTDTFFPVAVEGFPTNDFYVNNLYESKGFIIIHTSRGIFFVDPKNKFKPGLTAKKIFLSENNVRVNDYAHYMNVFDDRLFIVSNKDAYSPDRILVAEISKTPTDTVLNILNRQVFNRTINRVAYSKEEKKIYLGTIDGISVCQIDNNYKISDQIYFKGYKIYQLICASDHRLYCSGSIPELLWMDLNSGKTGKYVPDPLKFGTLLDNNITCLFEDYSGSLWVGHQGLGLSILNLYRKAFYSYQRDPSNPMSLSGNIVMCFNGTSTETLIGLRQEGINVASNRLLMAGMPDFKSVSYSKQPVSSPSFNTVWDIAKESETVFWVASDAGVAKLEKTPRGWIYGGNGEEPLYTGGTVRKILIDQNKNIWIGSLSEGLIFYPALRNNPEKRHFVYSVDPSNKESLTDRTILSMKIDSRQRFWIGTNNGLNLLKTPYDKLDLSGNVKPDLQFTQFIAVKPDKNYLNANEINCIYENSDGKIWVATQGGGISIVDPQTMTFTNLSIENGLPGNDIQGILSDTSGIKWISSNKGITAYNQNNTAKAFTYYKSTDGLQGETFKVNSYYQSADGQMFFGGDNGFTTFYPGEIKLNPIPPKIGLTSFRIDNVVINVGDTISKGNILSKAIDEVNEIELPYTKNSFSIGVGVNHFQFPEGNKIRYKLDSFYDYWIPIPASNRFAYFSKIPPGNYTLHISGVSSDNVAAETEKTILIHILPPWYKTWYFRTFVFFVILSMIGFLLYWLSDKQKQSFQQKIDAISFENNENKMRFLTNIAHELRTPLSLVIAPIEDMKQNYKTIDPAWKNHLTLIYRNSNYLLTLINQIIDFRKLNAGKLQLNLQSTDIVNMVKEVVLNFKGLESRRKTNLQIEVPDRCIFVDIDRQKIEEVLYNLLSNAFKHTSENHSIKVTLEWIEETAGPDSKNKVRITVFNEGKDISDEDKTKIFERFYKVSEKVEGAGIGLSFSKSLIEMHNGTITVESVDSIGVAFHVDLPFDKIEITNTVNPEQNSPDLIWQEDDSDLTLAQETENKGKEMSLVIVEDNTDLRTFLKNALSGLYNCYEAGDGKEGYELITRIIPDIIISDVIMPKMDGYELCTKVKENTKTCHIPIILLTANNATEHVVSGYEKGADAYVTKPFDMSIIKAQILRLIKNRELIREKYVTQNFMVEVSQSSFSKDDEFIIKLRQLLEANLSESDFNVKKLSEDLNISTTHLYRKLKALTGFSPVEFIRVFKLQKACEMLSNTNHSIKEIGYGLGFNNLSYFVKCFREQFGVTPSSFRQNGLPNPMKNDNTNQSVMS
jgi:signal transduction histidine kinase/DNA-binding response OmpR family regulator/ligand-binding sensor domain-containing protein